MSPKPTLTAPPTPLILKFSVPSIGVQKALRFNSNDSIWNIKKTLMEKIGSEIPEFLNYGLFLPGSGGKQGKFLDEKRVISHYNLENQVIFPCLYLTLFMQFSHSPITITFPLISLSLSPITIWKITVSLGGNPENAAKHGRILILSLGRGTRLAHRK